MSFLKKSKREDFDYEEIDNEEISYNADELLQHVKDYYTIEEKRPLSFVQRGMLSKEEFLEQLKAFLFEKYKKISPEMVEEIKEKFHRYVWGYHVLDTLINDPTISDIRTLTDKKIRIKRLGKREFAPEDIVFKDVNDYKDFINYVAVKNSVNISDINALQNFTDKSTNENFILRFDITTPFLTSTGLPYMHIRKISKEKPDMIQLKKDKMLDDTIEGYINCKVKLDKSILFTGKGASGKTTFMNAMLELISYSRSGLVIQENEELYSYLHPELMFKHTVLSNGEGKIQYELKELARLGLTEDLDYFIIGEIKGGEALYFLNAAYTGHTCWASVHGASATEAMNKVADYVKYSSDYSKADALQMLTAMSTVIFMKNYKVHEIAEVVGFNPATNSLEYDIVFDREKGINKLSKKTAEMKETIKKLEEEEE